MNLYIRALGFDNMTSGAKKNLLKQELRKA